MEKTWRQKNIFSFICIFIVLGVYVFQVLNTRVYEKPNKIIAWDVMSYYGYLPATFIDNDYTLSFLEEGAPLGKYWYHQTENGGRIFKTSMGMSMMYAPFFFIADALAEPLGYEADGYTAPYSAGIAFGCIFYMGIGLFFLRKVLLKYHKDSIVAITLLLLCFCTNIQWYATIESGMSHCYSFTLFCIFLYLTEIWHKKPTWLNSILIGLISGLITLIRPTNAVVAIVFILYGISNKKDIKEKFDFYLKNYQKLLLLLVFAFLVWVPQLLYWKTITGDWLYYSYGDNERFYFLSPHIFQVLFSFRKGWLIYTPIMIFALIGIGFLWKMNRRYFYAILLFTVVNIYIVSSWWCWWYGGGFGLRALIESYAFLSIPLATFLSWLSAQKAKLKIPLIVLVFLISARSIFHTVQYHYDAIHWGNMTKEAYFDSFWRVRPSGKFYELLEEPDFEAVRNGKPEKNKKIQKNEPIK